MADLLSEHRVVAYMGHWLKAMKSHPRFISMAAAQASRGANYVLSFSRPTEAEPELESEAVLVA